MQIHTSVIGAIAGGAVGAIAPGMVREIVRGFTVMARSGSGLSPAAGNVPRLSRPVAAVTGASLGALTLFLIKE